MVTSFPFPRDTRGYLARVSFQEPTKSSSCYGSCVLLLLRPIPWCSGRPKCSFWVLWCSPSSLSGCTVLAFLFLPPSSLWIYFSFQHACNTFYFLYRCIILCLRMCVVCLCLQTNKSILAYSIFFCVWCLGEVRTQEQNTCLITVEGVSLVFLVTSFIFLNYNKCTLLLIGTWGFFNLLHLDV